MNDIIKFKKKLYLRIGISAFLLLTGIAISVLVQCIENGTVQISESEFIQMLSTFSGVAFGLIVISLAKIVQYIYFLRNKEALEKRMLMETDERNRYIGLKAWAITGYIMLYVIFISSFIAGFYSIVAVQMMFYILSLFALIYAVTYCILRRMN